MPIPMTGLLGPGNVQAPVEDIKWAKGAPPWSEKIVANDQIVGTRICQAPGHPHDRPSHLVDEWWFVVFPPIRPKGTGPTIRLAITPPGEFHRHDREPGQGPSDRK
jgi:hypothetical protein